MRNSKINASLVEFLDAEAEEALVDPTVAKRMLRRCGEELDRIDDIERAADEDEAFCQLLNLCVALAEEHLPFNWCSQPWFLSRPRLEMKRTVKHWIDMIDFKELAPGAQAEKLSSIFARQVPEYEPLVARLEENQRLRIALDAAEKNDDFEEYDKIQPRMALNQKLARTYARLAAMVAILQGHVWDRFPAYYEDLRHIDHGRVGKWRRWVEMLDEVRPLLQLGCGLESHDPDEGIPGKTPLDQVHWATNMFGLDFQRVLDRRVARVLCEGMVQIARQREAAVARGGGALRMESLPWPKGWSRWDYLSVKYADRKIAPVLAKQFDLFSDPRSGPEMLDHWTDNASPELANYCGLAASWWRSLSNEVDTRIATLSRGADPADVQGLVENSLRRVGGRWRLRWRGVPLQDSFNNLIGFRYIGILLHHPRKAFSALDLCRLVSPPPPATVPLEAVFEPASDEGEGDADDDLPDGKLVGPRRGSAATEKFDQATSDAVGRLRRIAKEREEALSFDDTTTIEQLDEECARISAWLSSSMGKDGKPREDDSDSQRARKRVANAVDRAIHAVNLVCEEVARHLDNAIHKGTFMVYEPDEDTAWEVVGIPDGAA